MSIDSVLAAADELHKRATRKAVLRLLSVMCAAYFMAYIDCTNYALAKTHLCRRIRSRRRHLLHQLRLPRNSEQPDHVPGRTAQMDRPDHHHLGNPVGVNDVRPRRAVIRP